MAPAAIPALTKKPFPLESHRVWLDSDRPVVRPVDICLERMEVKMKKATTKRLLATLLSFAMMFALVACSGNENGSSGGNNSANSGGTSSGGGHEVELIDGATAPEDLTFGLTPFEDRQTLRIGFFTGSPLSYAFLFADNLGVFDALNIDVEYSCFTGGLLPPYETINSAPLSAHSIYVPIITLKGKQINSGLYLTPSSIVF